MHIVLRLLSVHCFKHSFWWFQSLLRASARLSLDIVLTLGSNWRTWFSIEVELNFAFKAVDLLQHNNDLHLVPILISLKEMKLDFKDYSIFRRLRNIQIVGKFSLSYLGVFYLWTPIVKESFSIYRISIRQYGLRLE